MKLEEPAKFQISVKEMGGRWILLVDQESVISTTDRRLLQKLAAKLRQHLNRGVPHEHEHR